MDKLEEFMRQVMAILLSTVVSSGLIWVVVAIWRSILNLL